MKYEFIYLHRSEFRVQKMCQTLGVSRSAYYAYLRRGITHRDKANARLLDEIKRVYRKSRKRYGSPRITKVLQEQNISCSENRVARLMKEHDIAAKSKRKFKVTTDSHHNLPIAPNLVNQNFKADTPNQLWVSDITYIYTRQGWLYLCIILDCYSRKIVGWAMQRRMDKTLVINAFMQAVKQQNPRPGLIFHSDRGSQYASTKFRNLLKSYGFIQSMSRKANCYDNAMAESFFHTLKVELVYFEKYMSINQAKSSLFEYIEIFYNRHRLHSAIGYLAPCKFEKLFYENSKKT